MDKSMFDTARKIIQLAIDSGMEVSQEELDWMKNADQEHSIDELAEDQLSNSELNRSIMVTVLNDNKDLVSVLEKLINRPTTPPIVTVNAPANPPVIVNAQVQMPETREDIVVERDQNGLITGAKKVRRKKAE